MPSPTSPIHGKLANLYRLRPNGFKGGGLNDITWGTGYSGADAAYFEVEIDAEATPDTFKWRQDGGAYTEDVAITGAAQTLAEGQTVIFSATTGHLLADRWMVGNFKDELCSESGSQAQVTEATRRLLNPNNPPTFTDDGGANVLTVDNVRGLATFDANVGAVDVDGNLGWIPRAALEKVGYLLGWSLDLSVDMADASCCGQNWKTSLPGQSGGSGSAEAFFIGGDSGLDSLIEAAAGDEKYCLLELFVNDPDQDQTGDHLSLWAVVSGVSHSTSVGDIVKEPITFQVHGFVGFNVDA